jgi:hypothetical protein
VVFNWQTGKQVVPLDLGMGRVFKIGRQDVSLFVEPFWNVPVTATPGSVQARCHAVTASIHFAIPPAASMVLLASAYAS